MATKRNGDMGESGHLPTNVMNARRHDRSDDADAFMPDPGDGRAEIDDDIAETLAEEFVQGATSGQEAGEEWEDILVDEELGGPFIVTTGADEFAVTIDTMNPEEATREPLPRANAGMVQMSLEELEAERPDGDEDDDEDLDAPLDPPRPPAGRRDHR
jgi:hypothetical protein